MKAVEQAFLAAKEQLGELVLISRRQQDCLARGDFMEMQNLLERRNELTNSVTALWHVVKDADAVTDPQVKNWKQHLLNLAQDFVRSDDYVNLLLEHHMVRLGEKILRYHQTCQGTSAYRRVNQQTGALQQIYGGNARQFNESL